MARSRLEFHELLCNILGSRNCYYAPPASVMLNYPAIIYELSNITQTYADNLSYRNMRRYSVMVIDEDPDSQIPERLIQCCQYTTSDRVFVSDGLYHFTFTIFY